MFSLMSVLENTVLYWKRWPNGLRSVFFNPLWVLATVCQSSESRNCHWQKVGGRGREKQKLVFNIKFIALTLLFQTPHCGLFCICVLLICSLGCRVDLSPTDVSPTGNSWMLGPLNKASLGYCAPDQCVPTLDRIKHGTSSVGLCRGLDRPPAPNGSVGRLAGSAYAPDQVYWIGAPPLDARSAHK